MDHITHTTKSGKSFNMPAGYSSVDAYLHVLKLNLKSMKGNPKKVDLVAEYEAEIIIVEEYSAEQAPLSAKQILGSW